MEDLPPPETTTTTTTTTTTLEVKPPLPPKEEDDGENKEEEGMEMYPTKATEETSSDIEQVYAFRDAITRGAEAQFGIESKIELMDLFLQDSSIHRGLKLVPVDTFDALLQSFGIDPDDATASWITSHFKMTTEKNDIGDDPVYVDPMAMLNYLQLTPEAEEQSILSTLNDQLCDGAARNGIETKEELCAFLLHREKISDDDSGRLGGGVPEQKDDRPLFDKARLQSEAANLSVCVAEINNADGNTKAVVDKWERTSRQSFWKTVYEITPELAHLRQVQTFVDQVYGNDDADDTLDALHLLHDLKLWPGVVEQEHWDHMADALRHQLCIAAQKKDITTKETLCALFADADGRPRKLAVTDFLEICRDKLDLDLATATVDDDLVQPRDGELVAFVQCFCTEGPAAVIPVTTETETEKTKTTEEKPPTPQINRGLLDAGELLWKLMLWPGAEEEHRALAAGRALRQDLVTTAEQRGLETVGDLWATLMGFLTGDPTDVTTKMVPTDKLLDVLVKQFGSTDTDDLRLYMKHFIVPDQDEHDSAKQLVDLSRLLHHLELFSNDDDDDDDDDEDEEEFADQDDFLIGDDVDKLRLDDDDDVDDP